MPDSSLVNEIITSAGAGTAIIVVLILLGLLWTKHAVEALTESKDAQISELKAQLDREIAEKEKIAGQRDEAMQLATDKLVPMLGSFTATTTSLIPLLQDLVRNREAWARGRSQD